jgi:hypothetical protein
MMGNHDHSEIIAKGMDAEISNRVERYVAAD